MTEAHHELRVPASTAGFAKGAEEFRGLLEASGVTSRTCFQAELVFEEIVTNVIRHGYRPDDAGWVDVTVDVTPDTIVMTFEDDAESFDPLARPSPELPKTLDDAPEGGLGLLLVRRTASRVDYERTSDHRNRLTVTLPNT